MEESSDILQARRKKLEAIQALGVYPYGGQFPKGKLLASLVENFQENQKVETAGRLAAVRAMGKSVFCDLRDESGRIQLYVKRDHLSEADYALFEHLDIGDIVGVRGELFKTKTGEITIRVEGLQLLSKSLRPMPEKWHGLKDIEARYRQRYLDLISNPESKEIFKKRSLVIRAVRRYLDDHGYLEVETPMMHPIPGGAAGKPFKTHHEALDIDLFLRVAPELYLKRLLVGGFDKVYEINKSFRNEGISTRHNPEFTMLEVYTAYSHVEGVMALTEEIVKNVAQEAFGTLKLEFPGGTVDLSRWERVSFAELMERNFNIQAADPIETWREKLKTKGHDIPNVSRTQLINIVGELIQPEKDLSKKGRPIFVTDYFTELCPLAKKNPKNHFLSERFELYIGGMEIANGYSELNDPVEQKERLLEELREKGKNATADTLDEDFIAALEYGMPPAGGLGIGIDRLVMILTGQESIREVILFPQMRPGSPAA